MQITAEVASRVKQARRGVAAPTEDFAALARNQLQWLPDLGIGFLDIENPALYDAAYFATFRKLDAMPFARDLNAARVALVHRHWPGTVVDVGIGGGAFMQAHGDAYGWDINPVALRWLYEHERLLDLREIDVDAVTMWDSIEHMRNPCEILCHVKHWAFISTPIYLSAQHARTSKHFKPGEHLWYFTRTGLIAFMRLSGFELIEANWMETDLGREGIGSFAFRRIGP